MPGERVEQDAARQVVETDHAVEAGARHHPAAGRDDETIEPDRGLTPRPDGRGARVPDAHGAVAARREQPPAGELEGADRPLGLEQELRGAADPQIEDGDRPHLAPDRREPPVG